MKILVFNWQDIRNPFGGGAEIHLHEIFKRLAAQGHDVTLFCSMFPGALHEESIDGIRVIRQGSRLLFNYSVPREYRRRFRHEHYDIVVDDLNKIPFYSPLFVREPLLGMVLHLFGTSIFRETILPAAAYVYLTERLALSVYRKTPIAVISESTRQEMLAHGYPDANIHNVRVAVNHAMYRTTGDPKAPVPTVGYLGRIKKYKSVDHLLRAFAIVRREIPDARCIVIGDGDGKPALERLAGELHLGASCTFTGYLPIDEKVRLINTMHLVVNTSAKEGWGLTVTEANACGVPVIASNVPGLRDAVLDGKTGLLYEFGNVDQLAGMMVRVLKDERLRSAYAREAQAYSRTFSWDDCATRMLGAIEATLQGPRSN